MDTNLNGDLKKSQKFQNELLKSINHPLPFKASFYTIRNYSNSGEGYCNLDSDWSSFNYQYAEKCGNATHMGLITAEIMFCSAAGPGPDGIPYGDGQGRLIAANGDEVYIIVPPAGQTGYVVFMAPGTHPIYDAYFETPFVIVGGTGRFENASGEGTTLSHVDLFDENGFILEHRTDHEFTGVISY